jgi:hypothetical protein
MAWLAQGLVSPADALASAAVAHMVVAHSDAETAVAAAVMTTVPVVTAAVLFAVALATAVVHSVHLLAAHCPRTCMNSATTAAEASVAVVIATAGSAAVE